MPYTVTIFPLLYDLGMECFLLIALNEKECLQYLYLLYKYLTSAVFTLELGNYIPVEHTSLVHVEETVGRIYLGTADRLKRAHRPVVHLPGACTALFLFDNITNANFKQKKQKKKRITQIHVPL